MVGAGKSDSEGLAHQVEQRIEGVTDRRDDVNVNDVRAHIADDHVTVFLQWDLTRGEEELVRSGATRAVLELRWELQNAMQDELIQAVEAALDRRVEAFLSANHVDPNLGVETFVLAPAG